MGVRARKLASSLTLVISTASLLLGAGPFAALQAGAAPLLFRSMTISDNQAGHTGVTYHAAFLLPSSATLGSIVIEFCANSPLEDDTCTVPAGFDMGPATLTSQSGQSGFTISSASTANRVILTRPPAAGAVGMSDYVFDGVTNPAAGGPLFARIYTHAASDASDGYTDFGGIALDIQGLLNISLEVPPFLIFCVGENITDYDCSTATEPFSDLGDLTPASTRAAQHQLVVATNAKDGYSMWALGNTMTSGNNLINPMTTLTTSKKGTSQFGMNMRANTDPRVGQDPQGPGAGTVTSNFDQPDRFYFNSGEIVATTPTTDAYRKYTVSYIVNVPKDQPGGVYSTTLTYVTLANF